MKTTNVKGFEPAFGLLRGFEFDGAQSIQNALWLSRWLTVAAQIDEHFSFRPPLVVIEGPQGSGKTTLASRLCGDAGELPQFYAVDAPGHAFDRAAQRGDSNIIFEDVRSFDWMTESSLEQFLTAEVREFRPQGSKKKVTRTLRSVVIVTGSDIKLPEEMNRRAVFIRLKAHAEA